MKWLAALWGVAGSLGAIFCHPRAASVIHVVVLGNHLGYLSPCGCSSPMLGGILRQASTVRRIQQSGTTLVIDSGNISNGDSPQEILKAQTMAETLGSLRVDAVNLTYLDSKLRSEFTNLQSLSNDAWVSSTAQNFDQPKIDSVKVSKGFVIAGVSDQADQIAATLNGHEVPLDRAIADLERQAKESGSRSILMLDGSRDEATDLAKAHPALDLIVYNSTATPSDRPIQVGKTVIVAAGERGEYLIDLAFPPTGSPQYQVIPLGENIPDDPKAESLYTYYLKRVGEEHLWQNLNRRVVTGKHFVGSASCGTCHQNAYQVWKHSSHATALNTLTSRGHQLDPECLTCHVTGAEFKIGFASSQSTPQLAFVGCESCHGPGQSHVTNPKRFPLPYVTPKTCESCHDLLNSPHFDYQTYWAKVKH